MKMEDLIVGLNEYAEQYVVIKGPNGYRMDPDATHTREEWENVWTDDVSKAHAFSQKEYRRFMTIIGQSADTARSNFKSEPVELVDGVPTLPEVEKKGFGRLFRK